MALSLKHQRFVAEYLKDLNATQAAIRAGYVATNADVTGPRLLGHVGICAAIAEATAQAAARLEITADALIRDVADICAKAKRAEAFPAALKANELLGRTLGKDNPFSETLNVNATVENRPPDIRELTRDVAFLLASGVQALEEKPVESLH